MATQYDPDRPVDTKVGNRNIAVLGIYSSRPALENGVAGLRSAGFRNADISALFASGSSTKEFAHEKQTKLPEGAATGGTSGMILGGALGWLVGVGSLTIPGLGAFVAAGPLVSMLAGAAVGGAVGGLAGALVGLGVPEYEAKRYEGQVRGGGILISVHCDDHDWKNKAVDILKSTGAKEISSTGEASADYAVTDKPYSKTANY
jgi:hypothetical protein